MPNSIVIDHQDYGVRVALLQDHKLVELHTDEDISRFTVGDVFLGTVRKFSTGLNASFVDLGVGKDAFLHYHDLGPQVLSFKKYAQGILSGKIKSSDISHFQNEKKTEKEGLITDILKSGEKILVQISKEPISTKGARLTGEVTLAGRYLVLIPFSDRISVSSRITDKEERTKLIKLLRSIKPKNFGLIIRTVASETMKIEDLQADLKDLLRKWNVIFKSIQNNRTGKKLLEEQDIITAFLRDKLNDSYKEIIINNEEAMSNIKSYVKTISPDKEKIVKHYKGQMPVFDEHGVEGQIKASFGKFVPMGSGAYLVIEHTEALHVIDVNSGVTSRKDSDQESNALKVNLETVQEVARQLRLRDMGGIIVVDFIDMKSDENRKLIFEKMKEALSTDKAKHSILPLSRFGLMEITRERIKPVMNIDTTEECPSCSGAGRIESSIVMIERIYADLQRTIQKYPGKKITLVLHPFLEGYLKSGFISKHLKWEWDLKTRFSLKSSAANEILEYYFLDPKGEFLVLE